MNFSKMQCLAVSIVIFAAAQAFADTDSVALAFQADENCTGGQEAMHLLQARSAKSASADQVASQEEHISQALKALSYASTENDQDPCSSGLLGALQSSSPAAKACLAKCQLSCPSLNDAITTYLTKGGEAAAKASICKNMASLTCLVEAEQIATCMPMLTQAASFGVKIPTSVDDFKSVCK
ncbi:unnamed protein product [Polarella glacialis]|uniref:Uncharacterized protein n=1 Tax=Polarella glacialis TaxID=89957 RepID=A0A813FNH4_POLGL|nr:unnamed protein product [Polarella glacialis]